MELALFFYLADVVDNFAKGLGVIWSIWVGGIALSLIFMFVWVDFVDNLTFYKKFLKLSAIVLPSVLLLGSFIPSKDTMYTMAAAYGVQTAAENPNVQRVAGKSLQVLEGKLDEFLKEEKKE